MEKCLISIVIPVYNAEKYLRQCLDSIISLTYDNWECLLVDDGSKDGSPAICDEYVAKDSRFQVFHKENGGVSSARNMGLDNSNGQWICFVDADDYLSPNYLNDIGNDNIDLILFTSYSFQKKMKPYEKQNIGNITSVTKEETKSKLRELLHTHLFRVPWGKIIKKRCIGDIRFELGQKIGEDTVFLYTILQNVSSFKTMPDHIYYWQDYSCNDAQKYRSNVEDAIVFFERTYDAYKKLHIESIMVDFFLLCYFWQITEKTPLQNLSIWYDSNLVKECETNIQKANIKLRKLYYIYKKSRMLGFVCEKIISLFERMKKLEVFN